MYFRLDAPDGTAVWPLHHDGREARWSHSPVGIEEAKKEGRLVWKHCDKDSTKFGYLMCGNSRQMLQFVRIPQLVPKEIEENQVGTLWAERSGGRAVFAMLLRPNAA